MLQFETCFHSFDSWILLLLSFPILCKTNNRNSAVQHFILNDNVRFSCIKLYTSLTYITGKTNLHMHTQRVYGFMYLDFRLIVSISFE